MHFPTLTTERLTLRQLLESDVEEIFALRSDIKINKYLDRTPSNTMIDSLNFIRRINENTKSSELKYWGITLIDKKEIIGTICLFNLSAELKKCEIGYELLNEYQGRGLMKEATKKIIEYAFQTLGLKTIDAFTHRDNQRSTKLLQKFNFEGQTIGDQTNPNLIVFRLANSNE